MPAIDKEWMQNYLKKFDGSPIHVYIDEEEFYHPATHIRYTVQFVFSAMKPDGNWQTGRSQFEVNEDGLAMDNAEEMFNHYINTVCSYYRKFISQVMGFDKFQKGLIQRLTTCQRALKECNDSGNHRHERAKTH